MDDILKFLESNASTLSPHELEKAFALLQEHNIRKARVDFYTFVRLMAGLLLGTEFEDGPHIKLLCREYQELYEVTARNRPFRIQVSLPPRSMKTVLTNLFIAWVFGRKPNWKILHISHTQTLIEDTSGGPIRDLIQTYEYSVIFPETQIKRDSRSSRRWSTTRRGIYYCAGVDGKIQGRGANIVIGDDMLADHSIKSKTDRDKINRYYVPQVRSRIWKFGSEIQIGTRGHVNDILGFLQDLDGTYEKPLKNSPTPWKVIRIPAILDEESAKMLGLNAGEVYWPGTKDIDQYIELQRSTLAEDFAAIYLQRPVIEEGNVFKRFHFKTWPHSEPPSSIKFIFCSLDTAFSTKTSADYSAYTVWGIFERSETIKFGINVGREIKINNLILLEARRGRWDINSLFDRLDGVNEAYLPDTYLIENKGSGISLVQELYRRGWPVTPYNPTLDKVTRAHQAIPILASGRVYLPPKDVQGYNQIEELMTELLSFPNHPHDDLTDTTTMAINWLKDTYELSHDRYVSEIEDPDLDAPKPKGKSTYWALAS